MTREGLIAVNYAARAAGITRHMRVHEAKKHCPELKLVRRMRPLLLVQTHAPRVAPARLLARCSLRLEMPP
jgi:nucleotidyltransferase/DNA polymerase involved in DNA repair